MPRSTRTPSTRCWKRAASFASEVLTPINLSGDQEGCVLDKTTHEVKAPKGFKEAYAQYVEGGWPALSCDPEYGGQGLPVLVNQFMYWTGTMCLTEPHCGTDLGLLKTKAEPNADGSYSITGTKIFITAGEHDLTENIVHLVLAKLPDAPPGAKGISLFVTPKFKVNADGSLGERNPVYCGGLEHKMGIHGNATAQIVLDGAVGTLVGQPHKGLQAMFTMMNTARLGVGAGPAGPQDPGNNGATLKKFGKKIAEFVEEEGTSEAMQEFINPLADIATSRRRRGGLPARRGSPGFAYMWARMAKLALEKKDSGDPFYPAKLATARFYFAKLLPETASLIRTARPGLNPLMEMDEALF
ncbi:acyl-CoA dehydrogenase, middle domain-containing protein [Ditylenchus destructor]|nr:acyl-CoA dehydrogenase, middle domain-containing protein [Ditylenchus destructor]